MSRGNYDGGIQAAKAFLLATKDSLAKNPVLLNELTNSQIGVIQVTLAELLVTEVSVDENFEESLALLRGWSPLTPGSSKCQGKDHSRYSRTRGWVKSLRTMATGKNVSSS